MHYEADWGDLEGNSKFKRHLEKDRLYEFLIGLKKDLDEVRGRILERRTLPSIGEAFAKVRRAASRRWTMLGGKNDASATSSGERPTETIALDTKTTKSCGEQKNNQHDGRWISISISKGRIC